MPTRTHAHLPNRPVPQNRKNFSPIFNLSLRLKLMVAFLLVTALVVAAVAFAANWVIREELTNHAGANLLTLTIDKSAEIAQTIKKEEDTLRTIALNKLVQDAVVAASTANLKTVAENGELSRQWLAAVATDNNADPLVAAVLNNEVAVELRKYQVAFPQHAEILVTDRHGRLVAATNRTSDFYQADEIWWREANKAGQGAVYIGQPEFDESAGVYAINIALPIRAHNSPEVLGILRTTLNVNVLTSVLATGQFGQTGHTDIYLPDGREIELENEAGQLELVIAEAAITPETLEKFRAGTSYLAERHEAQPGLMAGALMTSPRSNSTDADNMDELGWVIVTVQDYAEALQPIETAARTTLLVALGALVGAGLLGLGAAQLLAAPITRLTAVVTRIAQAI
ncbi:MAG: hypothetical protein HC875_02280 [Anaerolineales bacterium]|nr:hypothetical protein [Anaerolineales bacterium]